MPGHSLMGCGVPLRDAAAGSAPGSTGGPGSRSAESDPVEGGCSRLLDVPTSVLGRETP